MDKNSRIYDGYKVLTGTRSKFRQMAMLFIILAGVSSPYLHHAGFSFQNNKQIILTPNGLPVAGCPFPLPNLLKDQPLQPSERPLARSSRQLHRYLSERTAQSDIDSLSIAIVTPTGTIFEHGYGVLKANETTSQRPVSRNSIYRIASITKMFTTLETLILRERGVLNLDDPIEKFLPDVKHPAYSWSDYLESPQDEHEGTMKPRITLRQLASHMSGTRGYPNDDSVPALYSTIASLSGTGRDYPPLDIGEWPQNTPIPSLRKLRLGDLPPPNRSYKQLVDAINKYPLTNLPYEYPIYSNSGIDLLGLANVAANKLANATPETQPQSHEELLKRDILGPLGLNHSFYQPPRENLILHDIAVPKETPEWADYVFDNADAPAGGQYSSLADLETVMRSFLDPDSNNGLISTQVVNEWLHPLFTWRNGFQETGAPWEITIIGGGARMYMKGGNLPGYHSEFALVPEFSYGVIVLLTGTYTNTAQIVHRAISHFQPATQELLVERVKRAYAGHWKDESDKDKNGTYANVKILNGGLYMTELTVRGYDILKIIQDADISLHKPIPVALWSTGRRGEFRLAFGRKSLNGYPGTGCMPYWVSIDNGLFSRDAPIDLVYWDGDNLVYPSAGVRMKRPMLT